MRETDFIGKPIRSLQTMLRMISKYNENVLPVVPDGIYGEDTQNSVMSFQREYSLPVTGRVDLETWDAVVFVYRQAVVEVGPAAEVLPALQPRQVIVQGETNDHLYMISGILLAISGYFPTMPKPDVGNVLTAATAQSVRWIQKRAFLTETGNIDRTTWRYITHLYRLVLADGKRTPRGSR